jgi:SET domain-containing protein
MAIKAYRDIEAGEEITISCKLVLPFSFLSSVMYLSFLSISRTLRLTQE